MNHLACQSTDMALRLVDMDQCAYNLMARSSGADSLKRITRPRLVCSPIK